ncbi:J domain-containing protein [Erwinia sp. JUb26]|uniref:J domain-containing protein n=1 Tax=Erwinia sp. JUb26 TaxID=2485126 RepID=UPI000F4899DA|nr:hypothetical protein [Erwinia sp. JUb26]ROR13681.1 hypothetical protein EC836_102597 [Erwinia sp. JUb26]
MNEWSVLGIDPTRDESEIRRAYVRQLKQHRPDRDPEGYQRLREAWEQAKRYAASESGELAGFGFQVQPGETGLTLVLNDDGVEFSGNGDDAARDGTEITDEDAEDIPQPPPAYSIKEINQLADRLLASERGMAQLEETWQRVAANGSLLQQQQFHQQLAQALVDRPGLTDERLMHLSDVLGWGLDGYDDASVLSGRVVWQLNRAARRTEVGASWQALLHSAGDSWRKKRMVALITGSEETLPLWARLIPNFLADMNKQVSELCSRYPELAERINPMVWQYSQEVPLRGTPFEETRIALSWAGIYLLLFWGVVINRSAVEAHPTWPVLTLSGVLILFYLYGHNLVFQTLRRWQIALSVWLLVEGILSALVVALFLVLMHFGLPKLLGNRAGLAGLFEIMLALIVLSGVWRIRERGVPVICLPGKLVNWLLAAPWNAPRAIPSRLLAVIIGLIAYFGGCAVMYEFFKLANNVLEHYL